MTRQVEDRRARWNASRSAMSIAAVMAFFRCGQFSTISGRLPAAWGRAAEIGEAIRP